MATKKIITIWGFMILVVIWICLVGVYTPAIGESMNFKSYQYPVKSEVALIDDVKGHILQQVIRRGFSVSDNGEVATWLGIGQNDYIIGGAGSLRVYSTMTFSDGSTIIWKAEHPATFPISEIKGEIIKGTGRFEGIKGTATGTSKWLPPEKGEDGQKSIVDWTFNYTLPSK